MRKLAHAELAEFIQNHRRLRNRAVTAVEPHTSSGERQPGHSAPELCSEALALAQRLLELNVTVVSLNDAEYPENLKEWLADKAPAILYVRGNQELLHQPGVGIIGTRRPTAYGIQAARAYARRLAECEITVVSGNAPGIDAAAHDEALREGGCTIVFPPVPIEQFDPSFTAEIDWRRILLVSSLPPGTAVQPWCFLRRNALAAAFCDCALVAETGVRGGTIDTIERLRAMGKSVFAADLPTDALCSESHKMLAGGGVRLVPLEPTAASLKLLSKPATRVSKPDVSDLFAPGPPS